MKHLGTVQIETDRLILRKFVKEDADAMFRNWASDPRVTKYLTWPVHDNIDITNMVIDMWIKDYEKIESYQWAIVLKEINEPIGCISVVGHKDEIGEVEIGYCIGYNWWNKGITSEALKAVIDFFWKVGAKRIAARHDADNPNSGRVMRKCGMHYEGTMAQSDTNQQGICDTVYYAVLKDDNVKLNCQKYEELQLNAFPAINTEILDGWLLRYSNGYTYRGNSVNPLYYSLENYDSKITECESRYKKLNLPCVFKLTPDTDKILDKTLERRNYARAKDADIMVSSLDSWKQETLNGVECSEKLTADWLEQFVVLNGTTTEPDKSTAIDILSNIKRPVVCASIYDGDTMAGCGLGVIEGEYIGLYDIRVREEYRRQGFAASICKKIIERGIAAGAKEAYLQVMSSNESAVKLYEKLGFVKKYTYWYRVK